MRQSQGWIVLCTEYSLLYDLAKKEIGLQLPRIMNTMKQTVYISLSCFWSLILCG